MQRSVNCHPEARGQTQHKTQHKQTTWLVQASGWPGSKSLTWDNEEALMPRHRKPTTTQFTSSHHLLYYQVSFNTRKRTNPFQLSSLVSEFHEELVKCITLYEVCLQLCSRSVSYITAEVWGHMHVSRAHHMKHVTSAIMCRDASRIPSVSITELVVLQPISSLFCFMKNKHKKEWVFDQLRIGFVLSCVCFVDMINCKQVQFMDKVSAQVLCNMQLWRKYKKVEKAAQYSRFITDYFTLGLL